MRKISIYVRKSSKKINGGYKGVVAVDRTSSTKLSFRKSMCKCKSESTSLDIFAKPSLTMMLLTFRASNPLELRTRTRIIVQNGRAVIGCLDETGTLE